MSKAKDEQTRTDKTEDSYIKRFESFIKAIRKENGTEPSVQDVAEYVMARQPHLSKSTWRQYKATMNYILNSLGENVLAERINQLDGKNCLNKASGTSSSKKKFISEKEETEIISALKERARKDPDGWAPTLLSYFFAGIACGLRPIEYETAIIVQTQEDMPTEHSDAYSGDYPIIIVQNAKATNGRSFGKYRYVGLSSLDHLQLSAVKSTIQYARNKNTPTGKVDTYECFYKRMCDAFSGFIKRFRGSTSNITMYSTRHQCIADLKYMGATLNEIAAIVGHGTDLTASKHYGKRSAGRNRGGRARGSKEDMSKIKQIKNHPKSSNSPKFI